MNGEHHHLYRRKMILIIVGKRDLGPHLVRGGIKNRPYYRLNNIGNIKEEINYVIEYLINVN